MKVYRIEHYGEGFRNHAPTWDGNDLTLCMLALEGDEEWSEAEDIEGRVTCPACARAIRYCKSIPARSLAVS